MIARRMVALVSRGMSSAGPHRLSGGSGRHKGRPERRPCHRTHNHSLRQSSNVVERSARQGCVILIRSGLIAVGLLIVGSSSAFAQGPTDGAPDPTKVRVKIGPLWLNPSIALTNLGI